MNRERAAELLPIITAFANGEDVQSDRIGERYIWRDRDEFIGTGLHWRIKPKLRQGFIHLSDIHTGCHDRKDCIKVIEVLE